MGNPTPDSSEGPPDTDVVDQAVERSFTCTVCGYGMSHSVGPLQAEIQSTCHNCGDWTVQMGKIGEVVDLTRDIATWLAGSIFTERQALAYLLRTHVGMDRQRAARAMDTTPSNLDNLHRRGREKAQDARRITEALRTLEGENRCRSDESPSGQ